MQWAKKLVEIQFHVIDQLLTSHDKSQTIADSSWFPLCAEITSSNACLSDAHNTWPPPIHTTRPTTRPFESKHLCQRQSALLDHVDPLAVGTSGAGLDTSSEAPGQTPRAPNTTSAKHHVRSLLESYKSLSRLSWVQAVCSGFDPCLRSSTTTVLMLKSFRTPSLLAMYVSDKGLKLPCPQSAAVCNYIEMESKLMSFFQGVTSWVVTA